MGEFAASFGDANTVEVLDIYPASEEPIEGVTSEALVKAIGGAGGASESVPSMRLQPKRRWMRGRVAAEEGDVILTQGAGSVRGLLRWCSKS